MEATVETEMAVITPSVAPARTAESAASWSAIVAGAVAAAALSLILLSLGTGLGLSSVSPWGNGASAAAIGYATAAWLLVTAAVASGLGGYLSGRLRTKWTEVDADEAHFRDTAHGFLAWAAATVVTAAVLTSAATSLAGVAASATGTLAATGVGAAAATAPGADGRDADRGRYFVDLMLRGTGSEDGAASIADTRREVAGVMTRAMDAGEMSQGDRTYLAQLVASRSGLSSAEADQRVTQVTEAARLAADAARTKALAAADAARSASAKTALWIFAAFLLGAFSAALAATWGGRRRDAPIRYRHFT
jgi:hypothetical protein